MVCLVDHPNADKPVTLENKTCDSPNLRCNVTLIKLYLYRMYLSAQNHIENDFRYILNSIVCLQMHTNKTTKLIMVYEHYNVGTIRNGLWHSRITDP